MLGIMVFVIDAALGTPEWSPAGLDTQSNSILFDKNGEPFAQLHLDENRLVLDSSQIPDLVKETFVAVEDKRFYSHFGVDPIRIVGSAINDIRARSAVEGASTITIQLARNAFIENPSAKTLTRKIQEAILAIQLEHKYTKDEILTFYLNRIFLGQSSFGVQTAALTYFGKSIEELEPVEVALLAGLPQAPSQYNPYFNMESARNRRNVILGVMLNAGIITADEHAEGRETPFTYVEDMKSSPGGIQRAAFASSSNKYLSFTDYVIEELEKVHGLTPEQIFSGGLQIYTTVNPKVQIAAEEAFANPNNFPAGFDEVLVQGSLTVIEQSSGAIQAMVGGRNYQARGLNRAWQTKRQTGSAIKPLVVFGPAIEKGGYFPGTVIDDMPVSYGNYTPRNYDTFTRGWRGLITMRLAVAQSVNVYAVKLLNEIGIDYGWEFGKNQLGLPLTENDRNLTLALGSNSASNLEMTAAYAAFANNGLRVTAHAVEKVLDSRGSELVVPDIARVRVMKESTAYLVTDMMRSAVTDGTAINAQIGNWAVAGKTGTTSLDPAYYGNRIGNPDAWFVGYTPHYVASVWMGYDGPDTSRQHYLRYEYGGNFPALLWRQVMSTALSDHTVQNSFTTPANITRGSFDQKSGLLPSSLTPGSFISTEIAAEGDFPIRVGEIWFQLEVDADDPSRLASAFSRETTMRTFLNIPNRSPEWPWPPDEAPFRPPSQRAADELPPPPDTTEPDPPDDDTEPDTSGSIEIPSPVLNEAVYVSETYSANITLTIPQGAEEFLIIITAQQSGKPPESRTFQSFQSSQASGDRGVLSFSLSQDGEPPDPGECNFWASFVDSSGSETGPTSNVVSCRIP